MLLSTHAGQSFAAFNARTHAMLAQAVSRDIVAHRIARADVVRRAAVLLGVSAGRSPGVAAPVASWRIDQRRPPRCADHWSGTDA